MPRYGPYKFYDSSVTLWFDSEAHTYLREYGEELVPQRGVTTILKIIDKSEFLVPWSAKRVAEKMAAIMPVVDEGLDVYTKSIHLADFLNLCDQAKKAPREILDDAGNVGEEAHRALEDAINFAINTNGGVVTKLVSTLKDPRAQSCCIAALDWMLRHNVRWLSTEQKIYSHEFQYAGTMDGRAYVSSCNNPVCCSFQFMDRYSIIDWKSSNQLSISYLYQVAAYRKAYIEETGEEVTDAFILRLGKEDGEFEPWHTEESDLMDDFETFKACLNLSWWHESAKTRMSEAMKARTVRKRTAAKEEKLVAKEAAKAEKVAATLAKKRERELA